MRVTLDSFPASRVGTLVLLAVSLGLLLASGSAVAGVVTQRYDFNEPVIKTIEGYDRVSMDGAWSYGDPGEPVLPVAGARLLLPPGETVVSVTIIPGRKVHLGDGYSVEPGQRQYPLSHRGPVRITDPDPGLYESPAPFPASLHGEAEQGLYRGYRIASVPLNPVEYVPSTGSLSYYRTMEVEIRTESDVDVARATSHRIRHDDATLSRLARHIDNPGQVASYASVERVREASRALDPALAYDYVIITTGAWESYLGTFVTYQTQRGYKAATFLKSWITANYTGADTQEQIRNFIIDAYNTWDCDYVLLVGDAMDATNGIEHRGFYADGYGTIDDDIPADMYYSALDGTWDGDGDGNFGEPGEEDYYPEVAIGRACASSAAEVQNFVTKTMTYTNNPVVSESDEALMVGELLWDDPTWGGDYKDEVKDGASTNGHTTAGFPGTMNVGTLYDRDATWAASTLISMMENGLNIVNHLGHCNTTYAMKMTTADIPDFDNDGTTHTLNFVYSQGCYAGAFDNRDPYGSYGTDCYAEEFACDDDGGVAVIMNGRYGWGAHESTNGSSQYYDREFFDAMFAEGIYPIGDANDDSKVDVIWAINYGANRWCYYQLNVFGDPALHLWTAEPVAMNVTHPGGIIIGQPDIDVTVLDGGSSPIEGARVTIYSDDYDVYDVGVTNASGTVTVHPNAGDTDTVHIKVTAHDHLVYDGSIAVSPASGPFVVYQSSTVEDDVGGGSNGNGDGVVNPGETIELAVTLENVGVETATGVTATLSTLSGYATITDDNETYGDIVAAGTGVSADDYDLVISEDAPDGETIQLVLDIQDSAARETWESNLSLQVAAPVLDYEDHVADDAPGGGNGNGCIEAGETITLSVSLSNSGGAGATTVDATLSSADPYVIVYDAESSVAAVGAGLTASLSPEYVVTILPACPAFHEIVFDLAVDADWGYDSTAQFSIVTGGGEISDDVESGEGDWTHGNVTAGFVDEWHIDTYRYHSSGHSWKFGESGSSGYGNSADGALETQPLCIGSDGEMTFWHWLESEEDGTTEAWDCCLVEITTDGGANWVNLPPVGGYTHTKNYNPANPLPEGTPCWSADHDWRQETFDLSSYEGETVQIRFRFASDGYVTEEGWYVDDIEVTSTGSTTLVDEAPTPRVFALGQNAPNPFNPVTVIRYQLPQPVRVRIAIYSVDGRHVKTIVDETQPAGHRSATWDGTNTNGEKVASGVYLYRMRAGTFVSKKRMVLLK